MFLLKPTIFAIFAVLVSVQADQSWYSFRTTFTMTGFPDRQPWLQSEAEDRGWIKVSDDCSEGARYSWNKITTTWIQIFHQNWNSFYSNASNQIISNSMTSLLTHNVAHSTRHSLRPKTSNQPILENKVVQKLKFQKNVNNCAPKIKFFNENKI